MGYSFVTADRDQGFLLAPDVREWLPEDHLAWCVIDVTGELDLAGLRAAYRADGQGRPAFDPAVMVALLLYCYCTGVRSSRAVERACQTDVACRVITGNRVIDHATVARFRVRHRAALRGLLVQSLAVCARAGMVKVGLVALDGTKVEAAASSAANRTGEQLAGLIAGLEAVVGAMLAQACAADEAEDALFGAGRRGDELPAVLARRQARLERLRAAKARLDAGQADLAAAQQAVVDAYEQAVAGRGGKRPPGRPPGSTPPRRGNRARKAKAGKPERANATDPDSRVMKTAHQGYLQGYNAQVLAGGGQLIVAAGAFSDQVDKNLLHPMLARGAANLDAAGITDPVRAAVAGSGYASAANFAAPAGPILLVAVGKDARQAGRDTTPAAVPRAWAPMAARLSTPAGRKLCKRRSPMVEPIFAQIFSRGGRRIRYRGLDAADTEIQLLATAHNLRKYYARWLTATPAPA
jgi:transposase